jgi:small GTP-binding protein
MTKLVRRAGGLTLAEVLRRAHRHELEELARAVGLPVRRQNRDQLARALERTLRTAGSNDAGDILLRRGKPPSWDRVLYDESRRLGLPTEIDDPQLERALLERLPPPRPPTLWESVVPVLLLPLRVMLLAFGPVAWLLMVAWMGRPRRAVLRTGLEALTTLREKVDNRYIIVVIGPPSVGKDAALRSIFDIDTGNVDPVAGATRTAAAYTIPGCPGLELVNTPGLGDVDRALTDETRALLDQADLFLFLLSAQTGVRTRERDEYVRARHRGVPVLVLVNKIDTLRSADRLRLVEDCARKLELSSDNVIGVALDPLPQLADAPVGVAAVRRWIDRAMAEAGRRSPWPHVAAAVDPLAPEEE